MLAASNSPTRPGSAIEAVLFLFFSILVINFFFFFFLTPRDRDQRVFRAYKWSTHLNFYMFSSKCGLDTDVCLGRTFWPASRFLAEDTRPGVKSTS